MPLFVFIDSALGCYALVEHASLCFAYDYCTESANRPSA